MTLRLAQRSFASGELDDRFRGLADNENYQRGLRLGKGVLFSEYGSVLKRYGTIKIAQALQVIPLVVGMEVPGVGARQLLISFSKIEIYDATAQTVEDTLDWGSEWDSSANILNGVPMVFDNQCWLFHPNEPTLIIKRGADGNWSVKAIHEELALIQPLLQPRVLSTTIQKAASTMTAGTKYFLPKDEVGQGTIWFIGTDDGGTTNLSGWVRANKYVSETIMQHSAVGDRLPTDGLTSQDWAGPWKILGTFANTITNAGTLTIDGDFTATLTGGETTNATDVGMIISFSGNNRLLGLVRKVASSTTYDCRVIDANGGSLPASNPGVHNLWRPHFREFDGNYLMIEDENTDNKQLFSFDPIMDAGMVASTNARDARFDIGNSRQVARVDTFIDVNNVTVDWDTTTWAPRDLAPRINYSPLMSDYHGWPGTGVEHQGRVYLMGFPRAPLNAIASKTNQPLNYTYGAEDDDAFNLLMHLARGTIAWAVSAQDLLVGTTLGEYVIRGNPVTPSNAKAELQTQYGGLRDRTLIVGGAGIFVTRCGCGLREMAFRFEEDRFRAPDLTDLNAIWDGIAPGSTIFRQPGQVREPNPLIFSVGDDSDLTVLTYRRENAVVGWSTWQFSLAPGEVEANRDQVISIAPASSNSDRDELWITTRRHVDGVFIDFVEIVRDDAIFDCQTTIAAPGSTTITGLSDYEGRLVAVVADDVWLGYYTVASDEIDLSNHLGAPPTEVILGYEIPVEIEPQVIQLDDLRGSGATDGRKRTVQSALLALANSYGGELGFIAGTDGGSDVEQFNPIFPDVVEGTTLASARFSGVKLVTVNFSGEEARPKIRALGPWPFELSAINLAVDIGDN